MQPSNTDAQPDGPAAINPTDKAAEVSARLNPAGAKKEPRLRPEPTPIFKGRTFYIAPGLPSHFEANLKEEIKLWDGLIGTSLSKSDYVLHAGTEQSDRTQSAAVAKLHMTIPPKIRSYHWFFACIYARPPRPLPKSQFNREMPTFTIPIDNPTGEERTRPTAFYLTKNMPPFGELHETSPQQALMAVAALIEINGGEISRTRAKADILILDPAYDQAQRFIEQMRPDQETMKRQDFTQIAKKKRPYLPEYWAGRRNIGKGKAGPSKTPPAPGADNSTAVLAKEVDDGHNNKSNAPSQNGRTEYSQEDDVRIVRWLTYHHPERLNWKSRAVYEALCDNKDPKHLPWAARHSAQSWHERVRKRHAIFASRADRLIADRVGLDRQLRTRAERVKAGLSGDRDRVPKIQDWVRTTQSADGTVENERPQKKVEKGKEMETTSQDDDVAEETDSFATSQIGAPAANVKSQGKRKEQDEGSQSSSQDPAANLEDHRPKRAKHRNEDPSGIASPAHTIEPAIGGDSGNQATTEIEDEAMPMQTTAHPQPSNHTMPDNSGGRPFVNPTGDDAAEPNQSSDAVRASDEDQNLHTADAVAENERMVEIPRGDTSDLANWTMNGVIEALGPVLASARAANVPPSPTHSQAYTEENSLDMLDDEGLAAVIWGQLNPRAPTALPAAEDTEDGAQAGPSRRGHSEDLVAVTEEGEGLPSGRVSTHLSESERRVNDLVFDNQIERNGELAVAEIEPVVPEAKTVSPSATSIVVTTETTSIVVSTTVEPEVTTTETTSTEAIPLINELLERPSQVMQAPAAPAATTKPTTKGKKRIANPQRAAELIKSTIEKYQVDARTVLAAMKSVAAASPEGKIDVTEVWRVIAEGKGQQV